MLPRKTYLELPSSLTNRRPVGVEDTARVDAHPNLRVAPLKAKTGTLASLLSPSSFLNLTPVSPGSQ